jgi:hypothetical protein
MNDKSIRQLAVSFALVIYSIFKLIEDNVPTFVLWIVPGGDVSLPNSPFSANLLAAAFAGLKIGIVIVLLEQLLYRLFARRIVGRWVYRSSSGNFAIAEIKPHGFWAGGTTITYAVNLYHTKEEVLSAMRHDGHVVPFGTADGTVTSFKDGKLTLIYEVHVGSDRYQARKGILSLSPSLDSNIMTGIWESTKINVDGVPDRDVRIGDLEMYRYRRFRKHPPKD